MLRGSGFHGVKCNLAAGRFGGVVSGNLSLAFTGFFAVAHI